METERREIQIQNTQIPKREKCPLSLPLKSQSETWPRRRDFQHYKTIQKLQIRCQRERNENR